METMKNAKSAALEVPGMEVTLYKTETCMPCKPTIIKMDAHEVAFEPITIKFNDQHEPLPESRPHLEYIKAELGYVGSPVTVVKIDDRLRKFVPDFIEELASSNMVNEFLSSLKATGLAHWHGFVPDRIQAVAHVQEALSAAHVKMAAA